MEVCLVPVLAAGDEGFEGPTKEVFQTPHWFTVDLGPFDFYLNKATALVLFSALFVGVLFWLAYRRASIVPRGLQNFVESIYDFIDTQISRDIIGKDGPRYTPYLMVLFSFVLICNLLAVIPAAQFPATSRIAIPMMLAVITWVLFNYAGIKAHGAGPYFKEMVDPAPTAPLGIRLLLAPIEILSTLIVRPFTLAVRLFANMFAGHMLLLVFSLGGEYMLHDAKLAAAGVVALIMAVVLTGFELIIDVLQAYIITVLTAAYIGGALAGHGGDDHHEAEGHEPALAHATGEPAAPALAAARS
ncbi:F0F1 ATP synthase subunit A [Frankia sp. CNm7]|uniref:ATP synthase subunit a n=1 Tax=Frankia nepalensis TaxID=1836974 RepID=A0A937RK44_9ACTN|nr:F0F1 ATP synthase subunit A [Frankia nepalensis]MBL7499718.1 F0F1 ATP synthase subunit A [Frankia nepalensis]MBL7510900.1 F0F1 ATP synthase subunit A [Frankia nepalensis]MBL7521384.1 F0F1 ATP synthase subunit A [Frankia nepalensis]MBL7630400.1 F0F1 ATP synthase subunit A [Frankia nepalensis]